MPIPTPSGVLIVAGSIALLCCLTELAALRRRVVSLENDLRNARSPTGGSTPLPPTPRCPFARRRAVRGQQPGRRTPPIPHWGGAGSQCTASPRKVRDEQRRWDRFCQAMGFPLGGNPYQPRCVTVKAQAPLTAESHACARPHGQRADAECMGQCFLSVRAVTFCRLCAPRCLPRAPFRRESHTRMDGMVSLRKPPRIRVCSSRPSGAADRHLGGGVRQGLHRGAQVRPVERRQQRPEQRQHVARLAGHGAADRPRAHAGQTLGALPRHQAAGASGFEPDAKTLRATPVSRRRRCCPPTAVTSRAVTPSFGRVERPSPRRGTHIERRSEHHPTLAETQATSPQLISSTMLVPGVPSRISRFIASG